MFSFFKRRQAPAAPPASDDAPTYSDDAAAAPPSAPSVLDGPQALIEGLPPEAPAAASAAPSAIDEPRPIVAPAPQSTLARLWSKVVPGSAAPEPAPEPARPASSNPPSTSSQAEGSGPAVEPSDATSTTGASLLPTTGFMALTPRVAPAPSAPLPSPMDAPTKGRPPAMPPVTAPRPVSPLPATVSPTPYAAPSPARTSPVAQPAPAPAPVRLPAQPSAKAPSPPPVPSAPTAAPEAAAVAESAAVTEARRSWMDRLKTGLRKTGSSLTQVFTGTQIDEALYEELETALLMADAGVKATEHLLKDLRRRVKDSKASDPQAVKALLTEAVTDLLKPLEETLELAEPGPTVVMVAGVNGAGKTTTIGKLTRHFADGGLKVLLAAADTFRAAAREQLAVWADRNRVEIVSQEGGDPAAVSFDAVKAGQARRCDVVIADTAGRLPTQLHLMDELKKLHRTLGKAMPGAPHEVLLVVDGNTGQNALTQVQAFDAAIGLTGLVVTKLDGTAKGGVLAAIALWSRERSQAKGSTARGVPVYFIGVGEKLEDLQPFRARDFAQALLS